MEAAEEEKAANAIKAQQRKEMMMKKLKSFIENAMWIKLKAIKKAEEEKLEKLREVAEIKRKETVLKYKQTMTLKKVPYDSDEDDFGMDKMSPAIGVKPTLLDQKHPAWVIYYT